MINVLLVEDDRNIADTVVEYLAFKGIECHHAVNGERGETIANEGNYNVFLLDINLPKLDGLTLCCRLRKKGDDTPILMLTAKDTLDDKLAGFSSGADDYLVKPFALEELEMRIKSLSKRKSGQAQKLRCADLEMDVAQRTVTRAGCRINLSPTMWKLLESLLRASPNVVSREALEGEIWENDVPCSNSLRVYICNLRKQIDAPFLTPLVQTVSRHGFALYEKSDK